MALPLRIEFEGAIYHVMVRRNARSGIFVNYEDREIFIDNLGRVWAIWMARVCLVPDE